MPLGAEVGLGPGHITLDEDTAPPPKKGAKPCPNFRPCQLWPTARWIKVPSGTEVGLDPGHIVLNGDSQNRHSPQFSAHVCYGQTAGWINMPLGTAVGRGPGDSSM